MSKSSFSELVRPGSAWSGAQIEAFLAQTVIPARIACTTGDGTPLICSLWFEYGDGAIWCATQASARVVEHFRRSPRCGFEIAPESMPYRGVRGQGTATLSESRGPALIVELIDRYLGTRESEFARWLIARRDDEIAIRIAPDWITSWDFSARMSR